ncbi:MAG: energy transducer TonB, partial [Sphingomonas bacterium]
LRSRATPVAAPIPVVPMPVPPLILTAPKPDLGAQATTGASDIAGPGTGAGGIGNGRGGGGDGDGIGPQWRSGRLKDSDYPAEAGRAGVSGVVSVRYLVGTDGRVAECDVTHSSGSRALDDTTCGLIRKRFRFSPARDGDGRPVPAWIVETHTWVIEHTTAPPDEDDPR